MPVQRGGQVNQLQAAGLAQHAPLGHTGRRQRAPQRLRVVLEVRPSFLLPDPHEAYFGDLRFKPVELRRHEVPESSDDRCQDRGLTFSGSYKAR